MHYNVTVDTPENSNVYLYQNITLTNFLAARDLIINITSTILDLTCDAFGIRLALFGVNYWLVVIAKLLFH